eukprot:IDg3124t1
MNKAVSFARNNRVSLKFLSLISKSIRVVCYSDSSFANNHDLSTQLGVIVLQADDSGSSVSIHFKYCKSKRVVRSAMAGEVIAFSDLFDIASTLTSELQAIYRRDIPVQLLTDSQSLLDVISKAWKTSEKRMMLDIAAS